LRYEEDGKFRSKKKAWVIAWRKRNRRQYNVYMKTYRKRQHQHELWLEYRTKWKAEKNIEQYLEVINRMENSRSKKPANIFILTTASID